MVSDLGAFLYGGAEKGINFIRQNNGSKTIGRGMGFGTTHTAKVLTRTLGYVSKVGKWTGVFGYAVTGAFIVSKVLNGQRVSTADKVGFGVGTVLIGAGSILAGTAAAPFVATAAIVYGAAEVGSYAFTGKTVEEHIFGK